MSGRQIVRWAGVMSPRGSAPTALLGLLTTVVAGEGLRRLEWIPLPALVSRGLEVAFGVSIALTWVMLQIGCGMAVLRISLFRGVRLAPSERWLFAFSLGSYVSHAILVALGLLGELNPAGLAGLVVVLIGCSAAELGMRRSDATGVEAVRDEVAPWPVALRCAVAVGLAVWALPLCVQVLLPSVDADGMMYHIPLAERFLQLPLTAVDPCFPAFDFPGAASLVYAVFLSLGAESAILPYSFFAGLLILPTTYCLAVRFWGRRVGVWATLFALGVNVAWESAITPRIDSQLALYFLLACFALLMWRQSPATPGYALLAGAALSMMLGVKYTAVLYGGVLGLGMLFAALPAGPRAWGTLVLAIVVALVPSTFWYARNWIRLADPLYPMLRNRMMYQDDSGKMRSLPDLVRASQDKLPTAEQVESTIGRYEGRALYEAAPAGAARKPRHLLNLPAVVLAPHWYEMKPFHTVTPYLFFFFLLPLLNLNDRNSLWLFLLGLVSYILVGWYAWVVRYVLPALTLFPIGAGVVLQQLTGPSARRKNLGSRWFVAILNLIALLCLLRDWWIMFTVHPATQGIDSWIPLIGAVVLAAVVVALMLVRQEGATAKSAGMLLAVSVCLASIHLARDWTCEWVKTAQLQPLRYLSGSETRWRYLERAERTGIIPLIGFINGQIAAGRIPTNATMLMVGEYKGHLLNMPYVPDNNFNSERFRVEIMKADGDVDRLRERLVRQGIRYILVNDGQIAWFLREEQRLINRDEVALALYYVRELLARHGRLVYDAAGMRVLEIE